MKEVNYTLLWYGQSQTYDHVYVIILCSGTLLRDADLEV